MGFFVERMLFELREANAVEPAFGESARRKLKVIKDEALTVLDEQVVP